jgi:5-enolpyruvylshikimate-3-phosphate synthase
MHVHALVYIESRTISENGTKLLYREYEKLTVANYVWSLSLSCDVLVTLNGDKSVNKRPMGHIAHLGHLNNYLKKYNKVSLL